jgi:Uma2 family endonuclease
LSPTSLEPDVVIYPRASGLQGPKGASVLLVAEIADSSLHYDVGHKAVLYASFGIRELWVIDAVRLTARMFREPAAEGYRNASDFGPTDRITPLMALEAFALRLDELELS